MFETQLNIDSCNFIFYYYNISRTLYHKYRLLRSNDIGNLYVEMIDRLTQLTTGYCYRCIIAVCYCFVIGRKSSGRPWDSGIQWECPRAPVLYYQETCRGPLCYWHCVRTGCLLDNCVWVVDSQPKEGRGAVFVVFCLELITSTTDFQFILC